MYVYLRKVVYIYIKIMYVCVCVCVCVCVHVGVGVREGLGGANILNRSVWRLLAPNPKINISENSPYLMEIEPSLH